MNDSSTYSVISTGQIRDEFAVNDVVESFAKLFKTTPEKASKYVGVQRILKKELNFEKAQKLKAHLEKIGMVIALKEYSQIQASQSLSLVTEEPTKPRFENPITCPKCDLEQEKAEQCTGCGVYINKVLGIAPEQSKTNNTVKDGSAENHTAPNQTSENSESSGDATVFTTIQPNDDSINLIGLGAAAGAAVLGALLWKFIAVFIGYEHGIIAWGIGAMVGVAAIIFGSKGMPTGVICGVFALLAILGGKYMAMASFQESWSQGFDALSEVETTEFREIYQEEVNAANYYISEVSGKESLKKFMAEYGYSESFEAAGVTSDEIEAFNEYSAPRLEKLASDNLSFDNWMQLSLTDFADGLENISTTSLVIADFGLLGFVFLFLGVGTAFKLGKGGE